MFSKLIMIGKNPEAPWDISLLLWAPHSLTPISLHPIALQCPAHSRYTNCLPPCLPSCANLDGLCGVTISKVSSTCKEGCICQPGYVLNNNKCVLQIHCGCKNAQGDLIPVSGCGNGVGNASSMGQLLSCAQVRT